MPNQDNRLDTSGLSYLWSKLKAVFSNKADKADTVLDTTLSRGRKANTTVGAGSFAFGNNVTASNDYAHAEGYNSAASNQYSHAEGYNSTASGSGAHAEGYSSLASGSYSHAEGYSAYATSTYSHAEGRNTKASANTSHAEGYNTQATGSYSHAEGYSTSNSSTSYGARGKADHAEGYNTLANSGTSSSYYAAHAEGYETKATGNASHAEGRGSTASGTYSHSEGYQTTASNLTSHAEGYNSTASNQYSHAEGYYTVSAGSGSHAEGYYAQATGFASHAEGYNTKAGTGGYNVGVHVFGRFNTGFDKRVVTITDDMAVEWDPHKIHWAYSCIIRYTNDGTTTYYSPHADVPAYNDPSWDINSAFWHSYALPSGTDPGTIPEWDKDSLYPANTVVKKTFANNVYYFQNHNEVTTTYIPLTSAPFYHVVQLNTTTEIWPFILEEVGNGIMATAGSRSNARTLDLSGTEYLMGDVYVGCNADSTGGTKLAKVSELPSNMSGATSSAGGTHGLVPAPSAGDQDKVLKGNGMWGTVDALPTVTSSDNGKFMMVVNGAWAAASMSAWQGGNY